MRRRQSAPTLFLLTCLALAGCSKNESHDAIEANSPAEPAVSRRASASPAKLPAPPVADRSTPRDDRPIIVAFGDSLSEGYGADPGKSYPDYLQVALDREGFPYRVVNLGISGDTTTGGLARIGSAIELRPYLVILELGGNDGLRGIPVSSAQANLQKMIVALKGAGIRVVLAGMTLPPDYGSDYIQSFEKIYAGLAAEYRLRLVPFLMEDIASQLATRPGLMQKDGIHPTAEGNRIVAETVLRVIAPELKRRAA